MNKIHGQFLVKKDRPIERIKYQVIREVGEFKKSARCIVVPMLSPDYYLLFSFVDLIITERGSALSHLAIVGMEHGLPIYRAEDIIAQIPKEGLLRIDSDVVEVLANEA